MFRHTITIMEQMLKRMPGHFGELWIKRLKTKKIIIEHVNEYSLGKKIEVLQEVIGKEIGIKQISETKLKE